MIYALIVFFIGTIFVVDGYRRTRRQNEWKRRWKDAQ